MPISPFGWHDFAPPYLSASNLEAMHATGGAYADTVSTTFTDPFTPSSITMLVALLYCHDRQCHRPDV